MSLGVNVSEFGADPTGKQDSWDAFEKAINHRGGRIYAPGHYRLSRGLHVRNYVRLTGDMHQLSSIRFDSGGLTIHNWKTALAAGYGKLHPAENSIFEGLTFGGVAFPADQSKSHGFTLLAAAIIRDCVIENFSGNGVHIEADAKHHDSNANRWRMNNVTVRNCENGIYTRGGDANAGSAIECDFRKNRLWGIWEESFLGNSYLCCHVGYNGTKQADGFKGGNVNSPKVSARNTFMLYIEGDQPNVLSVGDLAMGGVSFSDDETTGTGYVRIGATCSPLIIQNRNGQQLMLGGDGDLIAAFKAPGTRGWFRLLHDSIKKLFNINWLNSPGFQISVAAEGNEFPPLTVLGAKVSKTAVKQLDPTAPQQGGQS